MTYELAKELKDAGFPQGGKGSCCYPKDALVVRLPDRAYMPLLSELIDACGDGFSSLQRIQWETADVVWYAYDVSTKDSGKSSTPEEAVGRLWLALNKKV